MKAAKILILLKIHQGWIATCLPEDMKDDMVSLRREGYLKSGGVPDLTSRGVDFIHTLISTKEQK